MDAAEQELFAGSVRTALQRHTGDELTAALADLGWADALDADARIAVSTLFELQGRAGVASPALDDVIVAAMGTGVDAGVVLPALGTWTPPGSPADGRVAVRGLMSAAGARATSLLVAVNHGQAYAVPPGDLELHPIAGIDPARGLVAVKGRVAAGGAVDADWSGAVAVGRLALAHELVGASRTMLDLAREHALQRVQFGRPIAMFQAVRHRLAETLVAIEAADAVAAAAWEDLTPSSAAIAKAMAGRAARTASRHCQQVLAGIGFTTEHPFEGYVRRVLVLDQLLGSTRALTAEVGRAVINERVLPPLQPL
jgi:hypothetical protein